MNAEQRKSVRRQIITAVLLALAVAGGVVRWLTPAPSLLRDMGSLLLVLWLPIIGNIIAWVVARANTPRNMPPGFDPASAFLASAELELTLNAADVPVESRPIRAGVFPCMLVLGNEAFSARLQVPPGAEPVPEVPRPLKVEFLRPDIALPRLPAGTTFVLLSGRTLLGRGRMLNATA